MPAGYIDWKKLAELEEGEAVVRLAIAYNDLYFIETLDRTYERVGYGNEFVFGVGLYKMRMMLAICEEIRLLIDELIKTYGDKITTVIDKEAAASWDKLQNLTNKNLMAFTRSKGLYHYDNRHGFGDWVKSAITEVAEDKKDCPDTVMYPEGVRFTFADRVLNEVFKTSIWKAYGGTPDGDVNEKIYQEAVSLVDATMKVLQAIVEHYLRQLTGIPSPESLTQNNLNVSVLEAPTTGIAITVPVGDYRQIKDEPSREE